MTTPFTCEPTTLEWCEIARSAMSENQLCSIVISVELAT